MRMFLRLVTLVCLASPAFAQQRSARCSGTPIDPLVVVGPVYQDCDVDRPARLLGSPPQPAWNPQGADLVDGRCFRAEFQFVLDTLGVPDLSTLTAISSSSTGYTEAVRATLPSLRYEPARLGGSAVRQIVVYRQSVAVRISSSPGRPVRAPSTC